VTSTRQMFFSRCSNEGERATGDPASQIATVLNGKKPSANRRPPSPGKPKDRFSLPVQNCGPSPSAYAAGPRPRLSRAKKGNQPCPIQPLEAPRRGRRKQEGALNIIFRQTGLGWPQRLAAIRLAAELRDVVGSRCSPPSILAMAICKHWWAFRGPAVALASPPDRPACSA